jgi:hypothetical protein
MKLKSPLSFLALLLIANICSGAEQKTNFKPFFVPNQATHVTYRNQGQMMIFELRLSGADSALKEIDSYLIKNGWSPSKSILIWNLGSSNGTPYIGKKWRGQWANSSGDVIQYILQPKEDTQEVINGAGIYYPASEVESIERASQTIN